MRVIVAPANFKGSLPAAEAAAAIAAGVRSGGGTPVQLPVADGGEGTLDALIAGAGGTIMGVIARGPMGLPVRAHLGRLSDGTGVVEMAQASGLMLVPERERDPMRASSQGTGELIKGAIARRPHTIIVGLGDSATVDGGMGLAKALGVRFLDDGGAPLPDGGAALERLASIDASGLDERLRDVTLIAAADVLSPLMDAAHVFGRQKGLRPDDVPVLERGLKNLAMRLEHDLGLSGALDLPGAGAAGGCGAMLAALGATIKPGAHTVLDMLGFAEAIHGAALVITGEGTLDASTAAGKAPRAVADAAAAANIPCVAIAGDATVRDGFDDVRTLTDHFGDAEHAIAQAAIGLEHVARRLVAERIRA